MTLLFTAANWFLPQFITVTAQDDGLAEGTRFINIQHTVVQGAVPDDGGAYDGLAVAGVTVEVVDANSASVVVAPYDTGGKHSPRTASSSPRTPPPRAAPSLRSDAYAVVLSKQPLGTVSYQTATDGQTQISVRRHRLAQRRERPADAHVHADRPATWNTMQVVFVEGVDDNLKQGLHFSQVTAGRHERRGRLPRPLARATSRRASPPPSTATRPAASTPPSRGSTVTVTGPAFLASISGAGTQGHADRHEGRLRLAPRR